MNCLKQCLLFRRATWGCGLVTPVLALAWVARGAPAQWTPLFTNPSPSGPFDFVDPDGNVTVHPQRVYRAHQP